MISLRLVFSIICLWMAIPSLVSIGSMCLKIEQYKNAIKNSTAQASRISSVEEKKGGRSNSLYRIKINYEKNEMDLMSNYSDWISSDIWTKINRNNKFSYSWPRVGDIIEVYVSNNDIVVEPELQNAIFLGKIKVRLVVVFVLLFISSYLFYMIYKNRRQDC